MLDRGTVHVYHSGYTWGEPWRVRNIFFSQRLQKCKQNAVGMSTTSTSSSTSSTRQCLISFPSQDWWAGGFNLEQKRAGELVLNPQPWFKRILKAIAFSLNACMNIWFYGKPMFKSFSVTPKKHIHIYIYIYLDSPTTLNFWGLSRKMAFFSESTFFEIKYCFLHVSDVHSWRYSWNCGNQINVPHCQLATHCCRCHFCFGCLKVQEQRFPNYWFSFTCLMPRFRSCLLWVLDALCSFIIARMRVGLKTQLRTRGWIAQFWWQLVLGRFAHTTQTCKGLFSSNIPFFAEGRPDGVRKYGKMRPKYGNIRPAWARPNQKDFFPKNAPFFSRPSVHPSKLFQQLAPEDQGDWMCSNPVYIFA